MRLRVGRIERAFFGAMDDNNVFIPGLLQTAADTSKDMRKLKDIFGRGFYLIAAFVLLGIAHQFNAWDFIVKALLK